jgi:hypothetical protein
MARKDSFDIQFFENVHRLLDDMWLGISKMKATANRTVAPPCRNQWHASTS